MSSIREYEPLDVEIDQFEFDKKSANSIQKLQSYESEVMKMLKDLSDRIRKANDELKHYLHQQKEMERNYIQLINRDSKIATRQDLTELKEHIRRLEITIANQTEIYNALSGLAGAYKEYGKSLKELGKDWMNLNKKENEWHDSTAELKKAKDKNATGGKLDKIEKQIKKNKQDVQKIFQEKKHSHSNVGNSYIHVNQMWQKFKASIKNLSW